MRKLHFNSTVLGWRRRSTGRRMFRTVMVNDMLCASINTQRRFFERASSSAATSVSRRITFRIRKRKTYWPGQHSWRNRQFGTQWLDVKLVFRSALLHNKAVEPSAVASVNAGSNATATALCQKVPTTATATPVGPFQRQQFGAAGSIRLRSAATQIEAAEADHRRRKRLVWWVPVAGAHPHCWIPVRRSFTESPVHSHGRSLCSQADWNSRVNHRLMANWYRWWPRNEPFSIHSIHWRAKLSQIIIYLGEYDTKDTDRAEFLPKETLRVVQRKIHPLFKYMLTQPDRYDVALLKLNRPVVYRDNILPICLPHQGRDYESTLGVVAGWGKTDTSFGKTGTNLLQKVYVPIIDNRRCYSWHEHKDIILELHEEMFCAGHEQGKMDACLGDSGGPLVVNDGGRWTLVGITSAGFGCAVDHQPGIYHKVTKTVSWIAANINDWNSPAWHVICYVWISSTSECFLYCT